MDRLIEMNEFVTYLTLSDKDTFDTISYYDGKVQIHTCSDLTPEQLIEIAEVAKRLKEQE